MSGILNSTYNNVSFALYRNTEVLAQLQEQASTGSRINRASDDPSGAYRVMGLSTQERSLDNYITNISEVSDLMQVASTALEDMSGALAEVRVNLTQIASGTYGNGETGQQARSRMAEQINDTLERVVSSANTEAMGQSIFGGNATNAAPYAVLRSGGQIESVTYVGSEQSRIVELSPGVMSKVFYNGSELFTSDNREAPELTEDVTGAGIGSGTSNVKGDIWLAVTHDGTNYKLSIDGGTTEVTVPLVGDVSNLAVTNAAGEVLYVDATSITSTGTDMVRVPGTYDVFNVLINLRDVLLNTHNLTDSQQAGLIEASSSSIQELNSLLAQKQVSIGARMGFLQNHIDGLDNIKFNVQGEKNSVEEADIAQIAIDLARHEVLYEMSLKVASKLLSTSLLDFI